MGANQIGRWLNVVNDVIVPSSAEMTSVRGYQGLSSRRQGYLETGSELAGPIVAVA